jgi:3-methyladenine DNA glycosylase/8-oxoguanine DNA glycosylase
MPYVGLGRRGLLPCLKSLVNGITCQQLSLAAGIVFLNRLAERYGQEFSPFLHAFPRPQDLAQLHPSDLRLLG